MLYRTVRLNKVQLAMDGTCLYYTLQGYLVDAIGIGARLS